jgi:recombination protein RecA
MAKKEKKEPKPKTDEKGSLKDVVGSCQKEYGKESIQVGINAGIVKCDVISTGSIAVDGVVGVGGFPRGRIIEIYGPESSGKTTLCMSVVAKAQQAGGTAAFIDAECATDLNYTRKIGVDTDKLLFAQPDNGEQVFGVVEKLIRSNKVDVIVVDSVAAIIPEVILAGDYGDSHYPEQAKLISGALNKIKGVLRKSKTILIFTNQLRDNLKTGMGVSPDRTVGGRALKFYASVRMDIRRIGSLEDSGGKFGNIIRAKVTKNKVAPPFRETEFMILFGEGICLEYDLLTLGVQHEIVEQSGAWYAYKGNRLGQSKRGAIEFLKQNEDYKFEIEKALREKVFALPLVTASASVVEEDSSESESDADEEIEPESDNPKEE